MITLFKKDKEVRIVEREWGVINKKTISDFDTKEEAQKQVEEDGYVCHFQKNKFVEVECPACRKSFTDCKCEYC